MNTAVRYISLYVVSPTSSLAFQILKKPQFSLFTQIPNGFLLFGLRHFLRLDQQLHPPSALQARRRHRLHQRLFATREHRRVVYMADGLGTDVPQLVCDLYCDEWVGDWDVFCV